MENLTGELILKQLRKSYTPSLICSACLLLITGTCTAVCAVRRGIFDVATIICAVTAFASLILLLVYLFRWIFVSKSPVLQPFGNAIAMAGCIRAGGTFAIWHTPPYRKHQLIITEEYIVCPEKVQSYLALDKIMNVQRRMLNGAGFLKILLATRSFSAAKALGVSGKERRLHKDHPLPETEQFDLLVIRDLKKHRHLYYVSVADFHDVLAFLREYLPDAQIRPERSI